jgi:Flp pilus assembly pilin Flp
MTNRINVLWAIPPLLPFAIAAMIRLLWCILGPPWEPDAEMAAVIIYASILLSLISVVVVGYMQSGGGGLWWTFKKEKSDD